MKFILEPAEAEEYFFNSLCNGLQEMGYYNCAIDYPAEHYQQAKDNWKKANPNRDACYEDVLMQILKDGNKIAMIDLEDEEEPELLGEVTLKDVHEKVQLTPSRHMQDLLNENDDATTADCVLQTVFLGEIVYG